MAVGHFIFPEMAIISGIRLGAACAGIKQTERNDMLLIEMSENSNCAGVFTQNSFCAAPVVIARENIKNKPRWLLINSGNANAGTGDRGRQDALDCCSSLAVLLDAQPNQVLPFSTGVIGEHLPVEKMSAALPRAIGDLSEGHWKNAAQAIMTTDTFAKGASKTIEIGGQPMTITGISKGAGMIQPNMATMLAFIATDACVAEPVLQQCLQQAVEKSFNRITVDGDTSTNDACILMATGHSMAPEISEESEFYPAFNETLSDLCKELAEAIIRDGEGATKLMHIVVKQAKDSAEALRVGKTIAHSPLVKTAFFASDPNWGRILAAVGRAEIQDLQLNDIVIFLGDVCIVRNGGRADDYIESEGQRIMNQEEITVSVSLGRGDACEQITTCDFSYDYVRINAEYRT